MKSLSAWFHFSGLVSHDSLMGSILICRIASLMTKYSAGVSARKRRAMPGMPYRAMPSMPSGMTTAQLKANRTSSIGYLKTVKRISGSSLMMVTIFVSIVGVFAMAVLRCAELSFAGFKPFHSI